MSSWKDSWNASVIPQARGTGNGGMPYAVGLPP